jgi:hypothetical protein
MDNPETIYSYYNKQIISNNDEYKSATITRGYRRSMLSPSPINVQPVTPNQQYQLYNCYYTANNSNIKLIPANQQQQSQSHQQQPETVKTKHLIKLLNKSYFNKQIKKFFFYFFLFYLIIYYFSYFIFDAYIILKYIFNNSNNNSNNNKNNIIIINTFYAYISFTYQFSCFIIYMILFWLYYKFSNTYIGNIDSNKKLLNYCCCTKPTTKFYETKRFDDAVSLQSNDFSYHFSYPKQQQQQQQAQSSISTISTEFQTSCCCCCGKKPKVTTELNIERQHSFRFLYYLCCCWIFKHSCFLKKLSSSSSSSSISSSINSYKRKFNLRLFIIIISIILFLINIILIQVYLKSDIFKIENETRIIPVEMLFNSTNEAKLLISLFNDTDGVIDVILFILILYLFNLIKPLFILIISICLAILQTIFIIMFNKSSAGSFQIYIQVR